MGPDGLVRYTRCETNQCYSYRQDLHLSMNVPKTSLLSNIKKKVSVLKALAILILRSNLDQ